MPARNLDYRTLFTHAPDLLLALAPNPPAFTILDATNAYLAATLTTRAQIVGKSLFEVFPDNPGDPGATGTRNLRESLQRVIATRTTDTMAVQKYDVRRGPNDDSSFEERYWSPVNAPVITANGELSVIIHRVTDVTELVQGRQHGLHPERPLAMEIDVLARSRELGASNRQLRDVTRELERANDELERANKELEAFAYSVSHDLRAPLRAIDGFSKILLDRYTEALDADGRHFLTRVRAGTARMSQLIDALLDLSRLGRAPLRAEPVDLTDVARRIVEELRRRDPTRAVTIEIAEGLGARGDRRLLTIALENLLGNAWKFTGERAAPRIWVGRTCDDTPAFFVRDDGAGFDQAYADKLFAPFQRLHGAEFEGTGIGLATVARVVARHGGRIWARGAVGQGATFFFTLGGPT